MLNKNKHLIENDLYPFVFKSLYTIAIKSSVYKTTVLTVAVSSFLLKKIFYLTKDWWLCEMGFHFYFKTYFIRADLFFYWLKK